MVQGFFFYDLKTLQTNFEDGINWLEHGLGLHDFSLENE